MNNIQKGRAGEMIALKYLIDNKANILETNYRINSGEIDIIAEIKKPGRDPREEGIKPILRTDVLKIEDITEGMILKGTVRNVVDFGAFIDIGGANGLLQISEMSWQNLRNLIRILY